MNDVEDNYGTLLFFRKNGEPGATYPLTTGKTCIGSSVNADIRLKLKDDRLEEIHCIIDVTDNGIATIINKSHLAPVCVNTISVRKFKVLCNEDQVDLIGKKFQYLNNNISKKDVERHQALLTKAMSTPSRGRQSVMPIVQSTKKAPHFRTKISVQRKYGNHRESTPERKLEKSLILEGSKTISRLITSKAINSPKGAKKRRLSLDSNIRKQSRNPKVSERNIQLSKNIFSCAILEEEAVPSTSQLKDDKEAADFIELSNTSFSREENLTRQTSMRTPCRSSVRIKVAQETPITTPKSKASPTAKFETPKVRASAKKKLNLTGGKTKTSMGDSINNKKLSRTPSNQAKGDTPKVTSGDKVDTPKRLDSPKSPSTSSDGSGDLSEAIKILSISSGSSVSRTSLSSTNTGISEEQIFEDSHLSLEKTSLSKYVQKGRETDQYLGQSFGTRHTEDEGDSSEDLEMPEDETWQNRSSSGFRQEKDTSYGHDDISDIKRVFVPQRRPSIKRSYVNESKELSVRLSRSVTPKVPLSKSPSNYEDEAANSVTEGCVDLTTPKSAIRSRRSKSMPYKPIVEDITPVTPQGVNLRNESDFKTPSNTPGLFENIKTSVLRSRSRRRSSNTFVEESNERQVNNVNKRARESTGSNDISPKKRKMAFEPTVYSTMEEDLDASFSSFATDEIFTTDTPDEYIAPNTPNDFRNLTDKPLITDPQAKSLTEPRRQKLILNRRSLHAMRLESQLSDNLSPSNSSNTIDDSQDSNVGSRSSRRLSLKAQKGKVCDKVSKSPANDLSRVRGLKKLFGTPKEIKLPKNDLTDVRGVRHLFQTPKSVSSPMNDLSNIVGVKKLISTPNLVKSPKNDLTEIPNLRKLIYPVQENGPKNDLSDVAGVKKLLATPKVDKSPKNDLRHVPNLRRMMSPKQQNSPKNDLSDVAGLKKLLSTSKKQKEPRNDLTNVAGVKKLLSTPKKQNSPINDLTDVPNLQRIMFPKQQNSPTNDLSDVEGVADIFAENELHSRGSDVNDENLFDMLFVRKPIKTYSGRSLSPFTRKAMLFGGDQRKTVGDMPYSSPRVKKWLEDQAVIKLERVDDVKKSEVEPLKEEFKTPKATPRGRRRKALHSEEPSSQEEKIPRGRTRAQVEINEELAAESPRSVRSRQKRNAEHVSPTNGVNSRNAPEFTQPLTERHESVKNGPENMIEQITEIHSTTDSGKDEAEKEVISQPKRRGRRRKVSLDEAVDSTEHKPNTRRRKMPKKDDDETSDIEMVSTPRRRGRPRTVLSDEQANSSGRRRKVSKKDKDGHVDINITPLRILRSKLRIADSISQELEKPTEKGNMGKVREAKESTEEGRKENEELETKGKMSKKLNKKSDPASKTTEKSSKRVTRRNVIKDTEESPKEEDENIVQMNVHDRSETKKENSVPYLSSEETEPLTKKRGRRRVVEEVQETNVDKEGEPKQGKQESELVLEKVWPARRGRRKMVIDEAEDILEDTTKEEIGRGKKRSKRQPAKNKAGKVNVEEILGQVSTCTEEGSIKDQESVPAPERVEKEEPQKRGRKKLIIEEDNSKDNTEEKIDQVKKISTRQAAKNKTIKTVVEESFESSPRTTRQKKGSFNRYGSEFVTELKKGPGKIVLFEENVIEKDNREEIKETLRRSKRTRK